MAGVGAYSSNSVVSDYQAQISKLEADPNATADFKSALDRQLQAVEEEVALQSSPQAGPSQVQAPSNVPLTSVNPTLSVDPSSDIKTADPSVASNVAPATGSSSNAAIGGLPDALSQLEPDINKAAQVTGEDPSLMAAQVWQESRGQTAATTTNGETGLADAGLMQVDAATFSALQKEHPELQGKDVSDPLTNLEAGGFYEQDMKKQFGSDALALRAYNSGPGSVDKGNPNTTTTGLGDQTYVQKVLGFANDISKGTPLPS